jgi:hypothetical protein
MGCGGSRVIEEVIDCPLKYNIEPIKFPFVDINFFDFQNTIEKLEIIRQKIIDGMDELIILSGASAYISPNLENCFYFLCWKISSDNNGKYIDSGITFDVESKSIILKGDKNTEEIKNAFIKFNQYVEQIWNIKDELFNLSQNLSNLNKNNADNMERYCNQIFASFYKENIQIIPGKIYILRNNLQKGIIAEKISELLKTEICKNLEFINSIPNIIKEKIKDFDDIGHKSSINKYNSILEIVWHNLPPSKRYGSDMKSGLRYRENIIENKKRKKLKNLKRLMN